MKRYLQILSSILIFSFGGALRADLSEGANRSIPGESVPITPPVSAAYTGPNGKTYQISIVQPQANGVFPLFFFLVGTGDPYFSPVVQRIVQTMASRGVVAASIKYPNGYLDGFSCTSIEKKVEAIFDESSTASALSAVIKASGKADPRAGILVAGHSQGSWIAHLGLRFNPNVKRAWLLSTGVFLINILPVSLPCNAAQGNETNYLRAINGEADSINGLSVTATGKQQGNLRNVKSVLGLESPKLLSFSGTPAGAGWHVVKASEIPTHFPGHNYFMDSKFGPEPTWDTTLAPWGRIYNQDWLMQGLEE